MKNSYSSRLDRIAEQKSYKRLILSIIFGLLAFVAIIFWGVPSIISFSVFVSNLNNKNSNVAIQPSDQTPLFPPSLEPITEATNSSTINIKGYSDPEVDIELYLNSNLASSVKTDANGLFAFKGIELEKGNNTIYVVATNKTKKSDKSNSYNVLYKNTLPKLEITQPENDARISGSKKEVQISGTTDSGNTITVNDHVVVVEANGTFSYTMPLNDGENKIKINAIDQAGNQTTIERKVTYSF